MMNTLQAALPHASMPQVGANVQGMQPCVQSMGWLNMLLHQFMRHQAPQANPLIHFLSTAQGVPPTGPSLGVQPAAAPGPSATALALPDAPRTETAPRAIGHEALPATHSAPEELGDAADDIEQLETLASSPKAKGKGKGKGKGKAKGKAVGKAKGKPKAKPKGKPKAKAAAGKAKAKAAAGKAKAKAAAGKAKAKARAGLVLGCCKCRYLPGGCAQCKNPAFRGRRGPQ